VAGEGALGAVLIGAAVAVARDADGLVAEGEGADVLRRNGLSFAVADTAAITRVILPATSATHTAVGVGLVVGVSRDRDDVGASREGRRVTSGGGGGAAAGGGPAEDKQMDADDGKQEGLHFVDDCLVSLGSSFKFSFLFF
jgi:hypothetical protein